MMKLKELGIENNTVVIFASDNGPHLEGGADPDFFDSNGPLRGYKRDLFEGGIRTPMLVKWPGTVKPGTVSDHISAFWDILPTISDITGAEMHDKTDGISFINELKGKRQKQHKYLYWEFHELGGRQAVRMGEWKGIRFNVNTDPDGKILLFNLVSDQGENIDLAEKYPAIVSKIKEAMKEAHVTTDDFRFNFEKDEGKPSN
jgi:arylsulfatase A-like enzyme